MSGIPMLYSALLLTGVNLLLRLVSTGFQVFLSGRIGSAGVGQLQLVLSLGMLATTAGMAGVRTTAMYLTAEALGRKQKQALSRVLFGCCLYSLLCSGAAAISLYAAAPWLARNWLGDVETLGAIRLLALFLPIVCLCGVMTGYFTGENRIGALAAVEIAEQLCYMAVTTGMLTFWAGDDTGKACQAIVLGSGMGSCFTLGCLLFLRLREPKYQDGQGPITHRLLSTALPLALADDLKSGISTTENLMVPKRLALYPGTASPLAEFGTVCGMTFPVLMFPAAILYALNELLIPELARCAAGGSRERIRYLVQRTLRVAMLYGTFCGGLLFLLSRPLCLSLYQSEPAGRYLRIFSLLAPMLYCDAVTDAMTKGLGQQRACVRYNILTSGLDVALLYVLLPEYGMAGYFFSFLVTHLLNFCLSLRRLLKIAGYTFAFHIPALTASATLLSLWGASQLSRPAARVLAFLCLWASLLTLFRVVTREDFTWLTGLVRKK